jgi:folate receptor
MMRATTLSFLAASAFGWDECKPFKEIYPSGKELCEQMWTDSFKYEQNEDAAYAMWFFDQVNPNNAIASSLGKEESPDMCMLQYYHKQGDDGSYAAPSPENKDAHECHPWKDNACCHSATVNSVTAINEAYGEGYHWDRCGPLSNACEQFFIQEACFYECSPHAGSYRRYDDKTVAAFAAFMAETGTGEGPCYTGVYDKDDAMYQGTFEHDGATYQKSVFYGDGCYGPNRWQMYKMPIKASYCDAFYTACMDDHFCAAAGESGGSFFGCAADYREGVAAAEAEALTKALEGYSAEIKAEVRAMNVTAAEASVMAAALAAAEAEAATIPDWAIAIIVVLGVAFVLCMFAVFIIVSREKAGKPMFKNLEAPVVATASATSKA